MVATDNNGTLFTPASNTTMSTQSSSSSSGLSTAAIVLIVVFGTLGLILIGGAIYIYINYKKRQVFSTFAKVQPEESIQRMNIENASKSHIEHHDQEHDHDDQGHVEIVYREDVKLGSRTPVLFDIEANPENSME